jgi:hypothetical protein
MLERASEDIIKAAHNYETAQPEDAGARDGHEEPLTPLHPEDEHGELADDPRWTYMWLGTAPHRHLFKCLDPDAGGLTYAGPRGSRKTWNGGRRMTATCDYTGAILADTFTPNRVTEPRAYPHLLDAAEEAIGGPLHAVVADRGLHYASVFELNTRRGTASVMPWREPHKGRRRKDMANEKFDRHGVPRCKYCGATGVTTVPGHGFYFDGNDQPRIAFRCSLGARPGHPNCDRRQSIKCAEEWRMLLPLGLHEEPHYALKSSHKNREHSHRDARSRNAVAGNDYASRLKRRGLDAHRLRGAAQMLLDWFRLCLRHNWLSHPQSPVRVNPLAPVQRRGGAWWEKVLAARQRFALNLPDGSTAVRARTMNTNLPPPGGPDLGDESDLPPLDRSDERPF